MFSPVFIHGMNAVTPLGLDLETNWQQLLAGKKGIQKQDVGIIPDVYVSKIDESLLQEAIPDPQYTALEKMLLLAVDPIRQKQQPTSKTGFILSTTKGNINLLREGKTQEATLHVLAKRMAHVLGFSTEPIVVSHACVSGLLALSVAKRMIQMGVYTDAFVLAADALTDFVVSGFQAFQAMSPFPCKPFDQDRAGVSLGEAAACVYVSKKRGSFRILGESAINDANHISGPSRTGEGLYRSMMGAAHEATISLDSLDFISAHGTATLYNDEMEAIAFDRLGLADTPINSLKGYYGHTLGASGLLETVVSLKATLQNTCIPTLGFAALGVSKNINIVQHKSTKTIHRLLKTASGFGGSNAAMIFERER